MTTQHLSPLTMLHSQHTRRRERRHDRGCPRAERSGRNFARGTQGTLPDELGYEVTVVRDATADYSDEMMHAALDINIPNYASAIVTTSQIIASILAPNVMESVQT